MLITVTVSPPPFPLKAVLLMKSCYSEYVKEGLFKTPIYASAANSIGQQFHFCGGSSGRFYI